MAGTNPFLQEDFGKDAGSQERDIDLFGNILPTYSGLTQFMQGGSYSPERILELLRGQMGATPQMGAPNINQAQQYGQGAMNLASRSAAIQSQNAMQSMANRPGLSGAALQSIGGNIAQQAAGGVGQAGLAGYQQGLGLLQNTNLANQQALMQNRMGELGIFGQGLGQAYGASGALYGGMGNAIQQERNRRTQSRSGGGFNPIGALLAGLQFGFNQLGNTDSDPVGEPYEGSNDYA